MSVKNVLIVILAGFLLLCGGLIVQSGVLGTAFSPRNCETVAAPPQSSGRGLMLLQQTTEVQTPSADANAPATTPAPAEPNAPAAQPQFQATAGESYGAVGGSPTAVTVGSTEKTSPFKFQLVLDSMGAAIRTATFSEFDSEGKNPEPLQFLAPVDLPGQEVLSLANRELVLVNQNRQLNLGRLSWESLGIQKLQDGGAAAAFQATIVDGNDRPILRLVKTYRIHPEDYMLTGDIRLENLSDQEQKAYFLLNGPAGLEQESGYRVDMRQIIAAFRTPGGQIQSTGLNVKALAKAKTPKERELKLSRGEGAFLWAANVNKYFAAILVPTTPAGQPEGDWVADKWGVLYNPDQDDRQNSGDESLGFVLQSATMTLAPAGQANSDQTDAFDLYLGPKDKRLFDANDLYLQLGFVHTISFMTCCCPGSIINPLAFGILAIMNWMYAVIPNYGVVIIILVLLMRLILHPITKKSQIAMNKMTKLAPRAEEIKQKYGNNKAEMNKRLMELYREQGASPILGFLPMFVQMPIWIALWSAIYTSIDLRGAPFLPFWITDLSAPDALVPLPHIVIPLVGWTIDSINLLPILMGVAFYLQQKLMPTQQAAASTNPQMAQQQKIMSIMMPLLFPLMLYKAPSGVNLYIMSSTFAGVVEQYVIKKHIREKEEQEAQGLIPATSKTGGKVKKKKPKPFYRYK